MSDLYSLGAKRVDQVGFDYASLAKGAFGALSSVGVPAAAAAQPQAAQAQQQQPKAMATWAKVLLGVGTGLGALLVGAIILKMLRAPVAVAVPAVRP